jgi:hypothetical protein
MSNETVARVAGRPSPALNPEQLLIVQPWKDYLSRGLIKTIKVEFTPGGTMVNVILADHVKTAEGIPRDIMPPGVAKQIILDSGLIPKGKGQGKKQEEPLPVRSLCAKDAEDGSKLEERIKQVANKLGPSTALGRIGSKQLHIDGAKSFEEWWTKASSDWKSKLVMDQKHFDSMSPGQVKVILDKLGAIKSPFRGSFPEQSVDDSKEEETNKKISEGEAGPASVKKPRAKAPPKK